MIGGQRTFPEIPPIFRPVLTRCLPAMPKLTKRIIDAARAAKGEIFLWDDELPGFGLRVKASGAKSFLVQYRNANGRSRRLTLGRYGVLTVEEGRREAKLALANVLKGADPAETRKLERGAVTMEALCREYLDKAERGLVLTRRGDAKSPTTLYVDKGRIERHIIPLIGKRTVKDLTSADVRRFQQNVISGKSAADIKTKTRGRAIVKGGRGTASRTMGLLGGIMKNWSGTVVAGLKRSATCTVRGAISFNSSTHLPPSVGSLTVNPVTLPPGCVKFATKPLPIGSDTPVNTMGIVRVSRARAPITGVVTPRIASGRRSTSSFANVLILSASPAVQRASIRRLRPSVHPSFVSAPRNTASQDCATPSLSALPISTPIRRIRSPC